MTFTEIKWKLSILKKFKQWEVKTLYNYQIDEKEIKNKLKLETEPPKNLDDLSDIFNEIDKENGKDVGQEGGYQKEEKEFNKKENSIFDEEKAKEDASGAFAPEMDEKKESILEKAEKDENALNDKKNSIEEEREENSKKIENTYENYKEDASKSAIRKGIARSSIIDNELSGLENAKVKDIELTNLKSNENIKNIENSMELLEKQKNDALKNFDISYALKINEKIEKLKTEHQKLQTDIDKYNQNVEKEKQKFNEEQDKKSKEHDEKVKYDKKKLNDEIAKYGIEEVYGKKVLDEKQDYAFEYLNSLPKDEAIELSRNRIFVEQLGANRAYQLYTAMAKRAN